MCSALEWLLSVAHEQSNPRPKGITPFANILICDLFSYKGLIVSQLRNTSIPMCSTVCMERGTTAAIRGAISASKIQPACGLIILH